jgi:hypothetical protein
MEPSNWLDFVILAAVLYSHILILITYITGNFGKLNTREPPNEAT